MAIFNYLVKIKSPDTTSRFFTDLHQYEGFCFESCFLSTLNLSEMVTTN